MQQDINLIDVRDKLYERLKPSGWADKLKTFLLSSEFEKILERLRDDKNSGNRFTPQIKQVFRAFEECPYNDLKVVMMGQDPYPYPGVCDGIAFSCANTGKPEASLRYIFRALEETVYPDGYIWDPDLARWSKQGVLLINTALTTTMGKVGQHYMLWRPFIAFVLDILAFNNPGLIYVYFGKKAQDWMVATPDNNYKITVSHPASAAHMKSERWECDDVFNKVNHLLYRSNGFKITW